MASRHLSRSIVMQSLYEWDFYNSWHDGQPEAKRRELNESSNFLKTRGADKNFQKITSEPRSGEDSYNKSKGSLKNIVERNIEDFGPGLEDVSFIWDLIAGVEKHLTEIDKIIEKAAPEWPIAQIPIIDRNVLRIGLYELLYSDKEEVPPKVAINEAIELAKTFSGQTSGKFVNGVLGTVYKQLDPTAEDNKKEKII